MKGKYMTVKEQEEKMRELIKDSEWAKRLSVWVSKKSHFNNIVDFLDDAEAEFKAEVIESFFADIQKMVSKTAKMDELFPLPEGVMRLENGEKAKPLPVAVPKPKREASLPVETPSYRNGHTPSMGLDLADVIANAVRGKIVAGIDREEVEGIVNDLLTEKLRDLGVGKSTITLTMPDRSDVETDGIFHRQTWDIFDLVRLGFPVWLYGGAGNGKTFAVRKTAEMLGLPCYIESCSAATSKASIVGYPNLATGDFVPGVAYKPAKEGGLLCLDEVDNADPQLLACVNALLGQPDYLFPNGERVTIHKDFRVVATANTTGSGCENGYVRSVMDAATLDRFAFLKFEFDADFSEYLLGLKSYKGVEKPKAVEYYDEQILQAFEHARLLVYDSEAGNTASRRSHRMLEGIVRSMRAGLRADLINRAFVIKGDPEVKGVL